MSKKCLFQYPRDTFPGILEKACHNNYENSGSIEKIATPYPI
ncbi:hypothetical protein [Desulfobacula toluolica]|nr:hypothetical protein [Desulfobacula toluolica]